MLELGSSHQFKGNTNVRFSRVFLAIIIVLYFLPTSFAQDSIVLEHGSAVRTVDFSPVHASLFASGGDDHTIKLWNLQEDTVTTLRGHTKEINSVAFSPNGQLLVSGGDDWTFKLWDIPQRQHIATLEHVTDRSRSQVKGVAFSPDGQLLATAGIHVKLWDVSNQTEIATLHQDDWVLTIAFSPNGQLLATGNNKGIVKIWNIRTRQVITQLHGDTTSIYAVEFSPDGRAFASAGYDGKIKLWNVSNWELIGTLESNGTVFAIDFSPNGKVLASTGHAAVALWSVDSGKKVASLTGHSDWVHGTAFSPDGTTLVSSGVDGTVRYQNIEIYLQTLQQPEMVRIIYFLPRNRLPPTDINRNLDILIKDVQEYYANQMQIRGLGRKTFTFETDRTGKATVHYMRGRFADQYYHTGTVAKVMEEVDKQFDLSKNIYLIAVDVSSQVIEGENTCGVGGGSWEGIEEGLQRRVLGGHAIIPASGQCFSISVTAHELGHAFGLEHDFRSDAYLMSYGVNPDRLSHCATDWLNVHRYFNPNQTAFNAPTTIEMSTPIALPSNGIRFRFEVDDADGANQAQLIIPTTVGDPATGGKLHSCKSLDSNTHLIEFTTTELTSGTKPEITLQVIDAYGNITRQVFPVNTTTLLPRPEVVSISDPNLAAAIRQMLNLSPGAAITQLNMLSFARFDVSDHQITNITGLEHAKNLSTLNLRGNQISNITPIEELTNLMYLDLSYNQIRDIASLEKLTKLNELRLAGNPIIDMSPLHALLEKIPDVNLDIWYIIDPLEKITGPWLWVIAPTEIGQGGANSIDVDSLAFASEGAVTEANIAANGAKVGDALGNHVWTLGEITETGRDNVNDLINKIGLVDGRNPASTADDIDINHHSSYALITLESATNQFGVPMRVGSDDAIKVWLNGEVVHNNPINRGANDFQDKFTVDLKAGDNLLLVKVSEREGHWSMFVGIDAKVTTGYKRPPDAITSVDVNNDGIVNIQDLVLVAANFGQRGENVADVNSDGVVNIVDLTLVAGAVGNAAGAPSAWNRDLEIALTKDQVEQWLHQARYVNLTDSTFQRGILVLEQLLAALTPKKTVLLPNYPNPFNPETWIPFQLAEPAEVVISIYAMDGKLVRRLDLGYQPVGIYESRSRAAYWDGKNQLGESIASGVYFYTLSAGDFNATRKMLIQK